MSSSLEPKLDQNEDDFENEWKEDKFIPIGYTDEDIERGSLFLFLYFLIVQRSQVCGTSILRNCSVMRMPIKDI